MKQYPVDPNKGLYSLFYHFIVNPGTTNKRRARSNESILKLTLYTCQFLTQVETKGQGGFGT